MKIKLIALFFTLCLGLASCSDEDTPEVRSTRTILVYMIANNNLDSNAADNLRDMVNAATNKNLNNGNLLVYYAPRNATPQLLQLKEENDVTKEYSVKDYSKQNSADPAIMKSVIQDVVEKFPADDYGLVLWSHGTGWLPVEYKNMLKAFGQDGDNWMELDELAKGLPDNVFDFILFDACYMASVECVYELKNKADYILASPTETMGTGWPYTQMIPQMFETNIQLPKIAETFYNFYLNYSYPYATVSLTKTSELEGLAASTKAILSGKNEEDIFNITKSKLQRLEYLPSSPGMLYDLSDYIKQLSTDEQFQAYTTALDKAVIYKAHTPKAFYGAPQTAYAVNSYCGLTAFLPQRSMPTLFDWYKQHAAWYDAVYK